MGHIIEQDDFHAKIWRLELGTPALGGTPVFSKDDEGNVTPSGGYDNIQAKLLADRTRNLHNRLLMLENQLLNARLTAIENNAVGTLVKKLYYPANLLSLPDYAFDGVLWLRGQAISRTTYGKLFEKVEHLIGGPLWGEGNGSSTFTLPDLRGEFDRSWDGGRGVDIGREFGSWQADDIKSHSHRIIDTSSPNFSGDEPGGFDTTSHINQDNGSFVDTQPAGGDETRPRNFAFLYCVRY